MLHLIIRRRKDEVTLLTRKPKLILKLTPSTCLFFAKMHTRHTNRGI